ncbi:ROK family protein, partial [bacterium]
NLRGEIKEQVEMPVSGKDGWKELELVCQIINELKDKQLHPIVGIGVGTAGLVNRSEGTVVNAVNLDWKDFPLGPLLAKKFGIPVSVLNDSQAGAMGEYVYGGDYRSDENLIVVNVNQGIGSGIFLNGQLFQGDGGGAGEIGHVVVVEENGKLCRCGRHGCLETVSNVPIVLEQLHLHSIEEVRAALQAGDPHAIEVVKRAAHYLGIALANVISILNIHKIVLIGEMTLLGEIWLDEVRASMARSALEHISRETTLSIGELGYRAGILGASASLLLDSYAVLFLQDDRTHEGPVLATKRSVLGIA